MSNGLAAVEAAPARINLLRRVFSFPAAISFLLAVLAVLTVRSRFDDPDMWWHLKLGQSIWNTHTIPSTDLYSYTTNHYAYVAHEWLAQLTIYGAYKLAGYSGLMLWLCCVSSAVLIAGYALCSLYSGNAKVAFLGAMTIWFFGTIAFSIRPQLLGYLLLIVELLLLHLGRTRDPRWFFGLPPLLWVWANCHGSFFFGIAVAGTILFSSWVRVESGLLVAMRWEPRQRRLLTWAFVLSSVAVFLNPVGIKLLLYPLKALFVPSIGIEAVSEWQPLQFSDARGIAVLGVLGCFFLIIIMRRCELWWHELLLLAPAAWLAVSHRRLILPFGILAAPVLSRLLANTWEGYEFEKDRPLPNIVLMTASLLTIFWAFPGQKNLTAQVEEQSPVKAVEFLKSHHLPGPMMNEWLYGGYLMWALPEYPDFIDGRGDVFEWAGILAQYGTWMELQRDPNLLLDKYGVNFCLLSRDSKMTTVLPLLQGWSSVYSDDNAVIFVRSRPPVNSTR